MQTLKSFDKISTSCTSVTTIASMTENEHNEMYFSEKKPLSANTATK